MPITRIVCRATLSDADLERISDILHDSLVREFAVPSDDKFQIFERLPERQRVYDRRYLSGGRSADFILFQITAGKPRSAVQKQRFYRALSAGLHERLGINPNDVMVTLQFTQAEDWSFSLGEQYCP
ncbi:tautomerase family protein [Pseudescherichia vulneris]|jgi:phenylpyruvate tautomerase PptA (4-oxalocrotonate tautomerase family)